MGVRLGTQDASARRTDWPRELVFVRAATAGADRPRPRWSQEVGAAVLVSVLGTVRTRHATTTA